MIAKLKDTVNLCFVEQCEEGEARKNIVGFCWISRSGFIFCNAALFTLLRKAKTAKLLEIMNCYKTKNFSFI